MNERLKHAYRQSADSIPPLGNANEAVRSARRRKIAARIGIPLVVCLVGATSVSGALLFLSDRGTTPTTNAAGHKGGTSPAYDMSDWAPNGESSYPPPGTVMYRTCAAGQCKAILLRPDGKTFDLSDERPDLVQRLESGGWNGATLSFDAKWLGIPNGASYGIYNLSDKAQAYELPAGPPGSTWYPIDWNLSSGSLALAQRIEGKVTAFALVATTSFGDQGVTVYQLAKDTSLVPIGNGGDSIQMIEPETKGEQWPRVTSLDVQNLQISSTQFKEGEILRYREPLKLDQCLSADETLLGPDGVPVTYQPPPAEPDGQEVNGVLAFRSDGGSFVPTGVIQWLCDSRASGRYDLPQSTEGTRWSMPMPITTMESLLVKTDESGARELDTVGIDHGVSTITPLPADALVLAPGMTSLE
jgi:hypothetical protein